jgi:hypothetical protein
VQEHVTELFLLIDKILTSPELSSLPVSAYDGGRGRESARAVRERGKAGAREGG